jgi:CHAT domain-containing protein
VKRVSLVVLALAALSGCARSASDDLDDAVRALPYRATEGRLAGMAHARTGPSPHPLPAWRGEGGGGREEAILAELNVRKVARRAMFAGASDALRARASLFAGDPRQAKSLLQNLTASGKASANAWNDYAVVLHATAAADDALQLTTALAAAEHALDLEPAHAEALFNRGVILETMSLRGAAVAAYQKYLVADHSSRWADEARERIRKLEAVQARIASWRDNLDDLERAAEAGDELFINDIAVAYPEESRRWCDVYLARWGERLLAGDTDGAAAMLLLSRVIGRALEKERGESLIADAVRIIETARDPKRLARAHLTYERGRKALARAETSGLEEAARQFRAEHSPMEFTARLFATFDMRDERATRLLRNLLDEVPTRYRALHAQIQWQLGVIEAREGSRSSALAFLRHAGATFEALGEEGNARRVRNATTAVLSAAGDIDAAWRMAGTALQSAEHDEARAFTLYEVAHVAAREERWGELHALLNAIAETPRVHELIRGEARTWRIVAASRAQMPRVAKAELQAARLDERASADLALAEALTEMDENAVASLTHALAITTDAARKASLLVARAGVQRALGQHDQARKDLEGAIALLDEVDLIARPQRLRDAILGSPLDAYSALADAVDRSGDPARAAEILERFRVWPKRPRVAAIQLRPHSVAVTYALYGDRVAIYAKGQRISVRVVPRELKETIRAFRKSLEGNDAPGVRNHGRALARVLIDPIASLLHPDDLLVIIPDGEWERLPFGALVQSDGRFLIENHPLVVAPSMSAWVKAASRMHTDARAVLSVGNSTPDAEMVSLPGAENEAREVSKLYRSRALLIGPQATKQRVISALAYSNIVHFAVHANGTAAMQPHLLLAAPDEKFTASEIAALRLDNLHAVVLVGCNTTAGPRSLVDAFLEAGAGNVVGTLWEVDDAGTRAMSVAFHRAFRNGATAAKALQKTQVQMIRQNAPSHVWAALQMYGSGD